MVNNYLMYNKAPASAHDLFKSNRATFFYIQKETSYSITNWVLILCRPGGDNNAAKYEECMEKFYSICDQMELHLVSDDMGKM